MNKEYGLLEYEIKNNEIAITGCDKNATDIAIPNCIEGKKVSRIAYCAFLNCKSLISVVIPNSVTDIGASAFNGCGSLKNIKLSDNISYISIGMFKNCISLENIIIPDDVVVIDLYAFAGCRSLKSITIPDSVIRVGDSTFNSCSSLKRIDGRFSNFPPKVEFLNLLERLNNECCHKM